ncbi:MAG: hypothetical protein R3E79_08420 [Caldilineaceae bacterium]
MIQDRERTPFNIGRRIDLIEFTLADAAPLQQGLAVYDPAQPRALLQQIFTWTNGHPYLTALIKRWWRKKSTRLSRVG